MDSKLIVNYEEINVLENGDYVVFDGKLAYFQCNHTIDRKLTNGIHSVTQVVCRRGQWFGLASLPSCGQSLELQSKGIKKNFFKIV